MFQGKHRKSVQERKNMWTYEEEDTSEKLMNKQK